MSRFSGRNELGVPIGAVVIVHLADASSVAGALQRVRRGHIHLTNYSIESNGVMHEMRGEGLRVPMRIVKLVEVKTP